MSKNLISIEPAAQKNFEKYEFPRNVREVENMKYFLILFTPKK
jgi:DNA-binding NtrC family response regulator